MTKNLSIQKIVKHCALECMRQKSGEMSVSWMFDAWIWTIENRINYGILSPDIIKPNVKFITDLAKIVEPVKNKRGFRTLPVIVGGTNGTLVPITNFEDNLFNLINNGWFPKNAEAFYLGFGSIHPFFDGNGRVGNILFNLLNGSMYNPVMPPEWIRRVKMGIVHNECKVSTSIADFLTFGAGELDENGFWEHPCYECARVHEEKFPEDFPCWPFSKEFLDERKRNKKWPFD